MKKKQLKLRVAELKTGNKELQVKVNLLQMQTEDKDIFLGSSILHTDFLEFMFQAHNAHDDLYYLLKHRHKELMSTSGALLERYDNMGAFLRNLSNTYADIRGVSKYTMQLDLKEVAK